MNPSDAKSKYAVLRTKCPHCSNDSVFEIASFEHRGFSMLGIRLFKSSADVLKCSHCGFFKFIKEGDFRVWRDLGWKYDELLSGEISEAEFTSYIESMDNDLLSEILDSAKSWTCSCGEKNPLNFSNCWSCGEAAPMQARESEDLEIDMKDRHPWEL